MSALRRDGLAVAAIVAVWIAVAAIVGLGGDFPLNDDWAYAFSARHLLRTGHLKILDWAAPSLVLHAAWGAAVLAVFGDSHVVLRTGTLGWALGALLALYALARRAGLDVRRSLVVVLGVGLSPWFVHLAFTYMTDVPWLALMTAALLAHLLAVQNRGGARLVFFVLAGTLVGAAGLIRQFAVVTAPAFLLVIFVAGREPAPGRWRRTAGWAIAFGLPLVAVYAPFHYWYAHVHGPTLAYRETWQRLRELQLWQPTAHLLVSWHYAGLWVAGLAVALGAQRRLGAVLSWRLGLVAALVLAGYAVAAAVAPYVAPTPTTGPGAMLHPTMPYLSNVTYLVGVGPPTIYDAYQGLAPVPHQALWPGILLTVLSTLGGVVFAGAVVAAARRVKAHLRGAAVETASGEPPPISAPARTLFAGFGVLYLAWQVGTGAFLFDRYLLPLISVVLILTLDVVPERAGGSRLVWAAILSMGLVSVLGTREYIRWNAARDRAVRDLEARGVAPTEIDGGFEVNGPRRFERFFAETGRIYSAPDPWWGNGARWAISFWPSRDTRCRTVRRYPYWSWQPGAHLAMHVLDCGPP